MIYYPDDRLTRSAPHCARTYLPPRLYAGVSDALSQFGPSRGRIQYCVAHTHAHVIATGLAPARVSAMLRRALPGRRRFYCFSARFSFPSRPSPDSRPCTRRHYHSHYWTRTSCGIPRRNAPRAYRLALETKPRFASPERLNVSWICRENVWSWSFSIWPSSAPRTYSCCTCAFIVLAIGRRGKKTVIEVFYRGLLCSPLLSI